MYPEFVAIYVGLGVLFVILLAVLILLIIVVVKVNRLSSSKAPIYGGSSADVKMYSGVVFCKKCASQFEASQRFCPKCGTPR